jgi:hypothetical protein
MTEKRLKLGREDENAAEAYLKKGLPNYREKLSLQVG